MQNNESSSTTGYGNFRHYKTRNQTSQQSGFFRQQLAKKETMWTGQIVVLVNCCSNDMARLFEKPRSSASRRPRQQATRKHQLRVINKLRQKLHRGLQTGLCKKKDNSWEKIVMRNRQQPRLDCKWDWTKISTRIQALLGQLGRNITEDQKVTSIIHQVTINGTQPPEWFKKISLGQYSCMGYSGKQLTINNHVQAANQQGNVLRKEITGTRKKTNKQTSEQ